ncbi:MAG: hypothetical protein ACOYVD_02670 [Bacillota bacterium]
MPNYQGDFNDLTRTKPLIRTVSSLKGFTNNVRMFVDSFEQLLVSVEKFAPSLEVAAKGTEMLVSKLSGPPRPYARPKVHNPGSNIKHDDDYEEEPVDIEEDHQ